MVAGCGPATPPPEASKAPTPLATGVLSMPNSIGAADLVTVIPTSPGVERSERLRFARVSTEQGLSRGTVTCMLQDRMGFVWFGTPDGLNRYDGYTCTVFRNVPDDPTSLSSNDIRALYEDHSRNLWIGTGAGGLNRFDRASGAFIHYTASDFGNKYRLISEDNSNTVTAIAEGPSGTLRIGTYAGLVKFDQAKQAFTSYLNTLGSLIFRAVARECKVSYRGLVRDPTGRVSSAAGRKVA